MNAVILGYGVVGKGIEILTNSLDDISIKYVYVRKEKENLPYFSICYFWINFFNSIIKWN